MKYVSKESDHRQHDDRTTAAGWPTTRQPQASGLVGGGSGGVEAFRQRGRPAVHGGFRAENRNFRLTKR